MAELTTEVSTYDAGPLDTYATLADGSGGSEVLASHINGVLSAMVLLQAVLGIGNSLKGSRSTLVARLATCLNALGALNGGTAFPTSPTPVEAQVFWRSDLKQLYLYDGALAQWQRIDGVNDHALLSSLASGDPHTQYLPINGSREFTGSLVPVTDNTHDIGSAAKRVRNIYAQEVFAGDVVMKNGWRITEIKDEIGFVNSKGRLCLILDESGGFRKA